MSIVFDDIQHDIANKGDRLCAIIYANTRPRIAGYIPLAKAISDHGHLCFLVHPSDSPLSPAEIEGYEQLNIGALPTHQLARLKNVDVFFSPEVVTNVAPRNSVTVGLHHSLNDQALGWNFAFAIRNNPLIIRSLDYYVAAEKQKKAHWAVKNYERFVQGIYPPHFLKDRREHLDIVPGGYPKIDYLERMFEGEGPADYISYCPTQSNQAFSEVIHHGARIIRTLLATFPHFKIAFRPYPSKDIEICRDICREFRENPRFFFDDSVTGIAYQKKTAVMVTDGSSAALTFSLSSGRPSVLVKMSDENERGKRRLMRVFGLSSVGETEMVAAISHCLDNRLFWHKKIMSERQEYLYNPGLASVYLASMLPVFARRESHPDWLSIPRTPWIGSEQVEVAKHHLELLHRLSGHGEKPLVTRMYREIDAYVQSIHCGKAEN